ncbi:MAG: DNA alkylation repair protein [Actinomycetota bacterium]
MAEPLKDQFTTEVAVRLATDLVAVASGDEFDAESFLTQATDDFDDLELSDRAQQIADSLAAHLPADRTRAMTLLGRSLGPELENAESFGMSTFFYWPHVKFVADHGHGDLDTALTLQYELTKRFTAEFSIRSYLVGEHRPATLERLTRWTRDADEHVRRLVSEGTRPRLPWAPRLHEFVDDPSVVLELLERLRHDESEYVRRSVANNLNDIAKDHPTVVVETCRRWWADADDDGRRMIRHALRTLIKAGDLDALDVIGFGPSSPARVVGGRIEPEAVAIGESVRVHVEVENPTAAPCRALVDIRVHFVKANGSTRPRVFKGAELDLEPGARHTVSKKVSVRQHSTRTHHPGSHQVEAIINGTTADIGRFELAPPNES